MKYRVKHRKPKYIQLFFISAVIILLFTLILKIEKNIRPVAELQSEHIAQKTASEVIEYTVSDYLDKNKYTYSDFAIVLYDDNKKVSAIETLPYNINKVQSELGALINQNLEKISCKKTSIPLGTLTNSNLLTGKGPVINIRVTPVGSAQVNIRNDFSNAGINQTCHKVSAVIKVKMTSSAPLYSFDTTSEFEFILAENIIVGNVPDISPYTLDGYAK
ncbi:sporulation protein YunB [Ruminococcus flavefaciens]|uniref:sporulation protein YunB n=1 Tax=Ruminococcus flavefaciens TaxID=1265 RepID=UPI0026F2A46D|nr:sporulation protein YunB [Ruminococcus flavefaciens]